MHAARRQEAPPLPRALAHLCILLAAAEPTQKEEQKKVGKHAKKRAKDDRERQIREAEMRRMQVGSAACGQHCQTGT